MDKISNLFKYIIFIILLSPVSAYTIELRTEFQDSAPKYIFQDGQYRGICFDIITELNKRMVSDDIVIRQHNPKIPFVPWKRIQNNLYKGNIDIIVGVARNDNRMAKYNFIDVPLYAVYSTFSKRVTDLFEYTGRKSLKDKRVVVIKGTKTAKNLSKANCTNLYKVNTLHQGHKMLMSNRADLLYYHSMGMAYAIKECGLSREINFTQNSVSTYHHYIALNRNVPYTIIHAIGRHIKQMKTDGTLNTIMNRYR